MQTTHPSVRSGRPHVVLLLTTIVALAAADPVAPPSPLDLPAGAAYPASPSVVDVTLPPYNARGDGQTDNTDILQRAFDDNVGRHRILYLPPGTYQVSRTLRWPKRIRERDNWGFTFLKGASPGNTTLRLKDATFTDPDHPQPILWCGGFGSADWFHNYIEDLTFDVGSKNPGAIGLQFYSNNSGALRHCRFIAPEGSGVTGLDLGHRDMNGPLLVRHCEVVGFRRGIACAGAVNSQTFEHIQLRNQSQVGLENAGQTLSIRGLTSDNAVPAVSTYGTVVLIDSTLKGRDAAANLPAIINFNGGRIFLRDVATTGYARALADVSHTPDSGAAFRVQGPDKPGSLGPRIDEYCSSEPTRPFPSPARSLRLEVEETPDSPLDPPATWANVNTFGADPTGQTDSSAAIQKAIDSGATTLFLPGFYALERTVIVRGAVRRIVGTGGWIDYNSRAKPDLRIADGDSPTVFFEHFAFIHGGIEVDTARTVVLRSVSDCALSFTSRARGSRVFLEDVVTHDLRLQKDQRVWARQLDIENQGTHLTNNASNLWILGYKTERGGTLLETQGGGRSEILGGFSYTTTAGQLAPMFVNEGSSVFAYFAEVCFNGDPFGTLIRESRKGTTRTVKRGEGSTTPYSGRPE